MAQTELDNNQEADAVSRGSGKTKWIVILLVLLFVGIALMSLPRGYSDDLSRVGKGQATLVMIRDKNSVDSMDLIHILDKVRSKYADKVEFLLNDHDTAEGIAFLNLNKVPPITLVLFDASGTLVKVLFPPQTVGSVQQEISSALGI